MRVCTPRRREAATIFIAFVILAMLPTDFMRCFTVTRRSGGPREWPLHAAAGASTALSGAVEAQRTDLAGHLARAERL